VRVDEAQAELTAMVDQIVDDLGFSVQSETPFFAARECTRVTGQTGAFSAKTVSGTLVNGAFRAEAVAAVLLDNGFELQRSDTAVEVFGRRDGMWVTVTFEPRHQRVSVDANTGCRAL